MRTGIKRVFFIDSYTTNAYPITKEVYDYLLPVYERGRLVEKAGRYWFLGNEWDYKDMKRICKYL